MVTQFPFLKYRMSLSVISALNIILFFSGLIAPMAMMVQWPLVLCCYPRGTAAAIGYWDIGYWTLESPAGGKLLLLVTCTLLNWPQKYPKIQDVTGRNILYVTPEGPQEQKGKSQVSERMWILPCSVLCQSTQNVALLCSKRLIIHSHEEHIPTSQLEKLFMFASSFFNDVQQWI